MDRIGVAGTRQRAGLAALAVLAVMAVVSAAVWWFVTAGVATPAVKTRAELVALEAELTRVDEAIEPIARDFTSEPATGLIEVSAYRTRIEEARRLVDDVNGLEVAGSDGLQIRDLIVTGGSEVLAGMDAALDALTSDDASATLPAATQVDAGLSKLQEARDSLDALLGRASAT